MELVLLVQLHEQFGVAGVHAGLYTILHQLVVATCLAVLVRILAHTTEGKEGAQSQRSGRVSLQQSVTDKDSIFVVHKEFFLLQDYTTHTINGSRNLFPLKFAYILMSVGAVVVSLILVKGPYGACQKSAGCI